MTPDETVMVKGSPVRSLQKFLESDLTSEQREAAFRSLPPEYASRFRLPILATETIPVHMLNRITEEAAKAKGEPVEQFAKRAGHQAASDAVKGIYRFFALVLTPPTLIAKASHMWSSLYNAGEFQVTQESDTSARILLRDFPSEVSGCSRITGWIERMTQLTGVNDIRVEHVRCFAKGDPHCEWTAAWR
jgi:hypothetical protein